MAGMDLSQVQVNIDNAMKTLRLTPETLPLLKLFPVIYVAWADHRINTSELQTILRMAQETELSEGEFGEVLGSWLQKEPSDEFWESGLYLMRVLLGPKASAEKGTMLELAEEIDQASEGLFGIPNTMGVDTNKLLQDVCAALGIRDESAREQVLRASHASFSSTELKWQSPIQWSWVQAGSFVLVLLLGGVVWLQSGFGQGILVPNTGGKAMELQALFQGNRLVMFVLLPLLPFLISGALVGWRSEGEIYMEAILAALIPLAVYWLVWLILASQMKQGGWDWQRLVLLFTFTVLAGAVAAGGAFLGDRLNSNRAVGM